MIAYNSHMNDLPAHNAALDACETKPCCSCACTIAARLNNGLHYLALGTWFGAIVMLAIGAAATFQTVRAYDPILNIEPWNQPELAGRAPVVLAGAIVGASLNGLKVVQIICAIFVLATLITQHTLFRTYLTCRITSFRNLIRLALASVPIAVLLLNIFWITPNVLAHRDAMWDMSAPETTREMSRQKFDRFHKLSERTVGFAAFALAGAVLMSSLVLGSSKKPAEPAI